MIDLEPNMIELDAIKEAAEKATPGPWYVDNGQGPQIGVVVPASYMKPEDMAFVAAANPASVLKMIAEIEMWRERAYYYG